MTHHARLNCPARAVLLAGLIFFLSAFSFPRRKGAVPASPVASETPTPSSTPYPLHTPTLSETVSPSPPPEVTLDLTPSSTTQPSFTPTPSETVSSSPTLTATLPLAPSSTNTEVPRNYPPLSALINEVAWAGTVASSSDEWIELLNLGPFAVNLRGWWLDDIADAGSNPYELPGVTLRPGEFVAFFRSRTRIALNDGGDTIRLLSPDTRVIDKISYKRVRLQLVLWASARRLGSSTLRPMSYRR